MTSTNPKAPSLHDALPIQRFRGLTQGVNHFARALVRRNGNHAENFRERFHQRMLENSRDRKSTRLNSSHGYISYAVFCLKKKKTNMRLYAVSCDHIICELW